MCCEAYRLNHRLGWSFVFEKGGYDGFSPDDVKDMLEVTGVACQEVTGYHFRNAVQVTRDFEQERFSAAFRQYPWSKPVPPELPRRPAL